MTTRVDSRSSGSGLQQSTAASDQPIETETGRSAATGQEVAADRRSIPRAAGLRLALADEARAALGKWVRGRTTPQRVVFRARVILLLADGLTERATARQLNTSRQTVSLWRLRVEQEGIATILRDRPGRGRKPKQGALTVQANDDTSA